MCLFSHPVPPNIAGTGEPQDFTVLRNRQVTLECKSDAVPPPVITWLKNGERLQVSLAKFHRFILRGKKKKSAIESFNIRSLVIQRRRAEQCPFVSLLFSAFAGVGSS